MRVVFLDFDGVLNSTPFLEDVCSRNIRWGKDHLDPKAVSLVDDICRETRASIVISSTWRILTPAHVLAGWLRSHGLTAPVLGVTPDRSASNGRGERGLEIDQWITESDEFVDGFVILDDDSDMAHLLPQLVQTDFDVGLTRAAADLAIEKVMRPWRTE